MPHMSSGGSEDFYSTDEVKVYKDEGNKDEEKRSSENLSEDKLGLVTETEEGKNSSIQGNYTGSEKGNASGVDDDKVAGGAPVPGQPLGPMGFFLPPPYAPYANGGSKFGMVQPPYPGLMMYNDFAQPPPAHMGIPPVHTDPKTGLSRHPMYATYPPHAQFPHALYGPDFPQVPAWHRPAGYPITTGAFSASLPPSLSTISRYGHPALLPPGIPHPGMPHPGMLPGHKSDMMAASMQDRLDGREERSAAKSAAEEKKKNYVKKPLNAFMLFMKEMRPKVIAECTLRESSAINQILGRKWHALDRSEQAKYYEMARKEKDLHLQLYPGWSARDNYAMHQKKKKRKKSESSPMQENKAMAAECPNAKKCRARYGMEQQSQWCKPCRRKKKCIRYLREDGASSDGEDCDDGSSRLGSHQSNCDTDSVHDMDMDSPHPDESLSFSQQHSPLSPLIQGEEELVDTTGELNLSFPVTSSTAGFISSTLPLDPPAPSLPPSSTLTSTLVKKGHPLNVMPSSGLATT